MPSWGERQRWHRNSWFAAAFYSVPAQLLITEHNGVLLGLPLSHHPHMRVRECAQRVFQRPWQWHHSRHFISPCSHPMRAQATCLHTRGRACRNTCVAHVRPHTSHKRTYSHIRMHACSWQVAEAFHSFPELAHVAVDPFMPVKAKANIFQTLLQDSSATEITKRLFGARRSMANSSMRLAARTQQLAHIAWRTAACA